MLFPSNGSRSVAAITNTAELVAFQEDIFRYGGGVLRPTLYPPPTPGYHYWHYVDPTTQNEYLSNNHFSGGNLLFADGHAKWRKYASLSAGEYGLTPDDNYLPGSSQNSILYQVAPGL